MQTSPNAFLYRLGRHRGVPSTSSPLLGRASPRRTFGARQRPARSLPASPPSRRSSPVKDEQPWTDISTGGKGAATGGAERRRAFHVVKKMWLPSRLQTQRYRRCLPSGWVITSNHGVLRYRKCAKVGFARVGDRFVNHSLQTGFSFFIPQGPSSHSPSGTVRTLWILLEV